MRNQIVRSRSFTRRALLCGAGQLALLGSLASRLYYLQVSQSEKYMTQSDGNRMRLYPVIPPRGKLFDRNGHVMAEGFKRYQAYYEVPNKREHEVEIDKIIKNLHSMLKIKDDEYARIRKALGAARSGDTILISDYLSWDDVARIEVNIPDLPGVTIEVPEVRNYPYGAITSHFIGYIAAPSEAEIKQNPQLQALKYHPEFRIGKSGLEKQLENELRGKPGVRQVEVDAMGRYVRELKIESGVPGENQILTVDLELQKFLMEQLAGKGGVSGEAASAAVLDITNGDVLAMGSVPSYDPNRFVRGIDHAYWKELINNPDKPLTNKAIGATYPPGSTFKVIVALAALESGLVNPDTTFFCPGHYDFGGRRFHCWERRGHGTVNVHTAISHSCNVYFYNVGRIIGVDKIAETANKMGLGLPTGIELPNEKSGLIPTRKWKRDTYGAPWYQGESLSTAIGQGYNLSSPLQLAVATARIASRGKLVKPRLVRPEGEGTEELVMLDNGEKVLLPRQETELPDMPNVKKEHLDHIIKGMTMVVNTPGGTVYRHRITEEGFQFAGKTGTTQVIGKTFKNVPSEAALRYHALFIGFCPIQAPRYAIAVVVEHGGYGAGVAAPIGRAVFQYVQELRSAE